MGPGRALTDLAKTKVVTEVERGSKGKVWSVTSITGNVRLLSLESPGSSVTLNGRPLKVG